MREILFRGFTPDKKGKSLIFVNGKSIKGQWVQGSYWKLEKTTYCFKEDYKAHPDNTEHYIVFSQMTDWGLPNQQLKADVIPETVGQYTGLTDKNGKRIFEGDIIKADNWLHQNMKTYTIVFENSGFYAKYKDEDCWNFDHLENIEVIGNIHDNPELLKGE